MSDKSKLNRSVFKRTSAVCLFTLCLLCSSAEGRCERYYQNLWSKRLNGEIEVVLPDGTRCDMITETHVIEIDFGRKWCGSYRTIPKLQFTNSKAGWNSLNSDFEK